MKTRRQFLTTTAAGSTGLALKGCGEGELPASKAEPGLIDAHVHVWTSELARFPLAPSYRSENMKPPSFTPEELFAHSRPQGVARIVLIQMSFYGYDNTYMLDVMKNHPGVFGGVAVIDETAPDLQGTMLALKEHGVRGFRIRSTRTAAEAWRDSTGMKAMWQTGAEQNLSMCLLADPDSLPAAREMQEMFPDTPVVIDHFARLGMTGAIDQAQLDELLAFATFPKCRVKTSAFYALGQKAAPYTDLGPMIRQLRDAFGANRLMWASDCPFQVEGGHTYADSLALIRDRLDFLSAEDKEWMLRKTAQEVFF